jgi:probable F420-dependent oxidoreductase
MTAVAGEVANGFLVHPFNSRETILANTMPALEKGLEKSGRQRTDLEISCNTFIVTADTEEEFAKSKTVLKQQLGFYGSTPAYLPSLAYHGLEDLHRELNRLARNNAWTEMGNLIDDDLLNLFAVVGERHEIAGKLAARLEGIADSVSLLHTRYPDPHHFADVVADLKRLNLS